MFVSLFCFVWYVSALALCPTSNAPIFRFLLMLSANCCWFLVTMGGQFLERCENFPDVFIVSAMVLKQFLCCLNIPHPQELEVKFGTMKCKRRPSRLNAPRSWQSSLSAWNAHLVAGFLFPRRMAIKTQARDNARAAGILDSNAKCPVAMGTKTASFLVG